MEIKHTLIEFHNKLIEIQESVNKLDHALIEKYKQHEERASKINSLLDSKEIFNHLASRHLALKQGRIRSHDNPIDSELEGLRQYADLLEETHKVLHEYLSQANGMKQILHNFANTIKHSPEQVHVKYLVSTIEIIEHQLVSENKIVREEELLIHKLTDSISRLRSSLSEIFMHDTEHTIRDQRHPLNLMKNKFESSDLIMRQIAKRVTSHNHLVRHHIPILIEETAGLITNYEKILSNSKHHDQFKRAA